MAPAHPSSIYTEQLQTVREGDALWFPEPHSSGEVQIGDVGYILEGAFIRLFNVISPEKYPVPHSELPDGFEPLREPRPRAIDTRERALAPGHHNSKSVTCNKIEVDVSSSAAPGLGVGTKWEYTCKKEKGAVLITKNFSTKKAAQEQSLFERYAVKHYDSWVKYAADMVSNVKPVLVRGWVKTTADWTATTFTSSGSKFTTSIGGGVPGVAGGKVAISRQNSIHGPVMNRIGLHADDELPQDAPVDQCVFIRSCHVGRRKRFLGFIMRGGAGPDQLPDQRDAHYGQDGPAVAAEDDQDDVDMADVMPQDVSYGPMDAVLEYIFEFSDAEIAVCCEEDLEFRLLGFDWPDDIPSWLRTNRPRIEVNDDGVGSLSLIEAIGRRRNHLITFGEPLSTDAEEHLPPPPPDTSSRGLSHQTPLGTGEVVLSSKPSEVLEWPHLMIGDNGTEGGSEVVMALSPDGKHIGTSCDDTVVTVWKLSKSRAVSRLEGHTDTVWALAFSPDSSRLVSGSADTTAIIWDLASASMIHKLEGHGADVWSVVYSPNGTKIATGSTDCSVMVWDAATGATLHTFGDHLAHVMHVAFSPDSATLASCADTIGIVWDVQTGETIAQLEGHGGAIWAMRFSHAGDRIVTGSEDCSARVWDAHTGEELTTLQEHTMPVWSVAFSPDDNEVVSGSYDCSVVTCDSWTGQQHHVFMAERDPSPIDTVAYSNVGDFLATGSADGHVRLWDAKTGDLTAEFRGHKEKVKGVLFNPNGSDVFSYSEDGTVRGWNIHDVYRLL